jgi:hypothetical protein
MVNDRALENRRQIGRRGGLGVSELLEALRQAGCFFGIAEAGLSASNFKLALLVKMETIYASLRDVDLDSEGAVLAFELAARAGWFASRKCHDGSSGADNAFPDYWITHDRST